MAAPSPWAPGKRLRPRVTGGIAMFLLSFVACAGSQAPDPRYRPSESVLEVVAVLRRHVEDDTYRFPAARDFTGRNVYRASLLRLENLERVHADALRAGSMDDVIAFSKGRALERIRAFDLAAQHYRRAAAMEGPLRRDALASAAICDALAESAALGSAFAAPEDAPAPETDALPEPLVAGRLDREAVLAANDRRLALLETMLADAAGSHYAAVIREEIERADVARAQLLIDTRRLHPFGDVRALGALQQVVVEHRDSKKNDAHLLTLADLYAELAVEYVEAHPPETLDFDPPHFEELVEAAARLYEAISNQDGAPEKLEAARRLEAFLAFTLKVDRDRFSP